MADRYSVQLGQLVRIPRGTRWVQFNEALSDRQHRRISTWLADHPEASLRVYGNYTASIKDLEFLRHYATLGGFEIDSIYPDVPDLAGLRHLPDDLRRLRLGVPSGPAGRDLLARSARLVHLTIGEHKQLPPEISGLTTLRSLFVAGPVKDLEVVAGLEQVEELGLGSVTVEGLANLSGLTGLRSLSLHLGGTRDLSTLPRFRDLARLELVMIRGFSDLSVLPELASLEHLKLEAMKNVTEIPGLRALHRLKEVELHTMKGIRDLRPIADAPNLEVFWLTSAMHLQPEVLEPFVGHPSLKRARVGFGSDRKNRRAREILDLPDDIASPA